MISPAFNAQNDDEDALNSSKGGLYGFGLGDDDEDDDKKKKAKDDEANPDEVSYEEAGLNDFGGLDSEDIEE